MHIDKKSFKDSLGVIKAAIAGLFMAREFMHSLPYPEDTGYIEFVGVLPEYQGRSIAKKIINNIIETSDYRKFILDVTDINIPAQKCYTRIGFREFQRISEKGGKIIMSRT